MAKICVINSLYQPHHRGGVEVVVQRIVDGLAAAGHQVIVITLGRHQSVQKTGRVTVYRIKPFNVFSFLDISKRPIWLRLLWHPLDVFNISGAAQVKKILLQEKPAVVFTHNLKGLSYLIPRTIKKLGLVNIHTLHDVQLSRPSGLIFYGAEKPFLVIDKIYEKICRRLFANPDVIISPSRWLLDYYKRRGFFYESEQVILPNPVVFQKVPTRRRPEGKERVVTFLYVGQLQRSKGVILLLEACRKIAVPRWKLLIAGSGTLETQIKKASNGDQRLEFLGWVSPTQLPEVYRQADLTVIPSLCYENSPTVVSESLVANVPVIAADIGGIGELVEDNYNGFTFAPGNQKNLTEVLEHFVRHPENIESLRKNCFVSVRDFSLQNYLKNRIR
jgi:glycosyltransferase involved in cell wall biosynthesis